MTNTESASAPKSGFLSMGWVILGLGIVAAVILGMFIISAGNSANRQEQTIVASWNNNQNILSSYANQMAESAQIPAQYKKDLIEVLKAEMEGRYGDPKDSKVLAKWIQERNLDFNSSLYADLQQTIKIGRTKFENAQTKLLDIKREYTTSLGHNPDGFFMGLMGYPRIDLEKYNIVINAGVTDTFNTGVEKPLDIFPKN